MSFIGFEMEITASVTLLYFNNISVAAFAQIKESFRKGAFKNYVDNFLL